MVYRAWRHALPDTAVIAIRLPGRESRLGEPPIGSMAILVETLGMEILPHLRQPFAFLGHSMGAIVAFELTRWLRSNGHALPKALHVSAARAPQYRLHHKPDPEPDEQSFVNELRRLEGMPREILDNPELMRIALPALRADAALYRQYVYHPDEPLALPIHAYGGMSDPNIQREHLEKWGEQTASEFTIQQFEGGHFYIHTAESLFLESLRSKLVR